MEDKWRIVKEQIGGGKRVEEGGLCPHSSRDGRAQVSHHWPVRCTWEVWATSLDPAGGSGSPGTQTSASWGLRGCPVPLPLSHAYLPCVSLLPPSPVPKALVSASSQQHSQDGPSELATPLLEAVRWIPHLEKNPNPSLQPLRSSVPVPLGLPFLPLGPWTPCSDADMPSSYLKVLDLS